MPQFKHIFWRYIPSSKTFTSTFKYVDTIETDDDNVPDFQDYYCVDQVINLSTGQIRIKNHSAPEYCVSKFVGWFLELPPVEKTNKEEIYVVIHRTSFSHKKIEFDEFLDTPHNQYTEEEWHDLLNRIEQRFNQQKEWAKDGIKTPSVYQDNLPVFQNEGEFKAFSLGRRAYFLYHLVTNYKFKHLIRKLNIGYTG